MPYPRYIQYPIQTQQNIVQTTTKSTTTGRRREKHTAEQKRRVLRGIRRWFILIWSLNHLTFTFFTSRKLTTFGLRWTVPPPSLSSLTLLSFFSVVKNNLNKTVEFLINFFKSHSSSPYSMGAQSCWLERWKVSSSLCCSARCCGELKSRNEDAENKQ